MRLELRDVKKDDLIWECEAGRNLRYVALENCRRVYSEGYFGYACRVRCDGRELELFEAFKVGGYGLRLYTAPMYVPLAEAEAEGSANECPA